MNQKNSIFSPLQRFTIRRIDSSLVLFIATVLAIIVANSPLSDIYQDFLNFSIHLNILGFEIFKHHGETMPLSVFANDVLMVLFFFVVGLDIKQQLLVGELSSFRKAILPVVGALGGMIMPVLIFILLAPSGAGSRGMAIPMATDIAFVLAVLSALKKHVPSSLRVFMTTLAVADDIGGIIVIALFYSTGINLFMLGSGLVVIAFLFLLGHWGVRNLSFYIIGLFIVWFLFLQSGIHTTIAGVLVALTVPASPKISLHQLKTFSGAVADMLPALGHEEIVRKSKPIILEGSEVSLIHGLEQSALLAISPIQRFEHLLTGWVNYLILPIFAFVNAGITFSSLEPGSMSSLPWAVMFGLLLGKSLGIFLFAYIFIRLTGNKWSEGVYPSLLFSVSILGGIGFTVSLFISSLSYDGGALLPFLNEAKIGILLGSLLSGVIGYLAVLFVTRRRRSDFSNDYSR